MTKSYSLLINSNVPTTAPNKDTSGGIGAYKYYINWGSFLPKEHSKFKVSFSFRSNTIADDPVLAIQIGLNMGSTFCFDTTGSQSSYIGSILPKSYVTDTAAEPHYYYEAQECDNGSIMVNYPSVDIVTVTINYLNNVQIGNTVINDYVLQINFEVIE